MKDINEVSDKELQDVSGGSGGQCFFWYSTARGDTWEKLANRYCTTVEVLRQYNTHIIDESLRPGYLMLIPDNR